MSVVSKVFGIWVVNKTVSSSTTLFLRLLAGMAAIIVCAITASLIIAILITGGVWLAYGELVTSGIDKQVAALIIGSLLLALLAAIMLTVKKYFYQLHIVSKTILNFKPPLGGKLSRVIDAFMEGLDSGQSVR